MSLWVIVLPVFSESPVFNGCALYDLEERVLLTVSI